MNALRALTTAAGAVLVAATLWAAPAGAQSGVAASAATAPDRTARLGPLCRTDTRNFRIWWTEGAGRPAALEGSDGNCRTLPPVVGEVRAGAEPARTRAIRAGFAATVGDAPPPVLRDAGFTRQLLRVPAAVRVQALRSQRTELRRAYLAGLTLRQFRAMSAGMPATARRSFARERTAGLRGTPRDFVGGDPRVDIVLDATGATGSVQPGQPGLAVCRTRGTGNRRSFVASWLYLLAEPGDTSLRATLAHEIFHVVQCVMNTRGDAPSLLKEGTAEWFSVISEPASFPGAVSIAPDGTESIRAGNARAASFCTSFDPRAQQNLDVYASWAVWEALDPLAPRATLVPRLLKVYRTASGDGSGVIRRVGEVRWSQALLTAVRSVCGNLRSPAGLVTFAPQVRGFLGARNQPALVDAPVTITVPAGGAVSVGAIWGRNGVGAATVSVNSPQLAPEVLAPQLVITTASGPQTPFVRDGQVVVDIPPPSLPEGYVPVTIANPSASVPIQVSVGVTALPAAPVEPPLV